MSLIEYQLLFILIVVPAALFALWVVRRSEKNEEEARHRHDGSSSHAA